MATLKHRIDAPPTELARRVRNFLHTQSHGNFRQVEVVADQDVVIVRGRVCSPQVSEQASDCCRRVAGVRRVVNEIVFEA